MASIDLTYYNISIATNALVTGSGGIDNREPETFGGTWATTKVLSIDKERANMRWEHILELLATDISPVAVSDIEMTGGSASTETTVVALTVGYDRNDYVNTEDEDNPGTFLSGTNAIQRYIARALIRDIFSNRDIYNPDVVGLNDQGVMIEEVTAVKIAANIAAAEAQITVIIVDLTN